MCHEGRVRERGGRCGSLGVLVEVLHRFVIGDGLLGYLVCLLSDLLRFLMWMIGLQG